MRVWLPLDVSFHLPHGQLLCVAPPGSGKETLAHLGWRRGREAENVLLDVWKCLTVIWLHGLSVWQMYSLVNLLANLFPRRIQVAIPWLKWGLTPLATFVHAQCLLWPHIARLIFIEVGLLLLGTPLGMRPLNRYLLNQIKIDCFHIKLDVINLCLWTERAFLEGKNVHTPAFGHLHLL